ncbi:hypothetical protein [uncultured Paraglaciecola sp.]|uniref:hypothetical protein n=1 Tax=uncultured Paraglaciecola sp. TaxID=1765024 RepID=UPI002612B88D|nr:hypothetical protein [uncultured Paraglaciecola sp.]
MGGASGSKQKSASGSRSVAEGMNQSRDFGTQLDPVQQAFQQSIWRQMGHIGAGGQSTANAGLRGGFGSLNASQNTINSLMNPGQDTASQNTLNSLMNPGQDPRMGAFARQLGRDFNDNIIPGIRSDAQQVGALGSSRAGIAEGLAGARAGQQLQDFGAQIFGDQQQTRLNAAATSGQLFDSRQQSRLNAASLGGQQAQAFGQLGQFGLSVPWFNLMQKQGLLGSPVQTDRGAVSTGFNRTEQSASATGKAASAGFNI